MILRVWSIHNKVSSKGNSGVACRYASNILFCALSKAAKTTVQQQLYAFILYSIFAAYASPFEIHGVPYPESLGRLTDPAENEPAMASRHP